MFRKYSGMVIHVNCTIEPYLIWRYYICPTLWVIFGILYISAIAGVIWLAGMSVHR